MRRNLPPKENLIGTTIGPRFPDHVITDHVDSGANGHLFRAYSQLTNSVLAFKVVPVSNLVTDEERKQYLDEARRANALEHGSVVRYIDAFDYVEPVSGIPCVVFICDYVDGPSLEKYTKDADNRGSIDLSFVRDFLDTMLRLLFELDRRGYRHGDLHAGNVLVVKSQYDFDQEIAFRITDFGVRNLTQASSRTADDFWNVASILNDLLEFIDYRELTGLDRFIFNALRDRFVKRYLLESDPTIDHVARNPERLLRELRNLNLDYQNEQDRQSSRQHLITPFDYPNCEQIGDSHLMLRALYSNRLLELSEIEAHSNVVLTGPRGCGKTTVFRALSLQYLTSTDQDVPSGIDYVGVYYRCDDLYFAFPRYTDLQIRDAIDIPMHFVIVTLLSHLLRQLERWATRYYQEEWQRVIGTVVGELWEIFDWDKPTGPNATELAALYGRLSKERHRAQKTYRFARNPRQRMTGFLEPGTLPRVCEMFCSSFSFLRNRTIHFYVDDYSRPKISSDLQANLNRLLMHRSAYAFFKISTESPVSFVRYDLDGKKYVEAREFNFINLGVRYITDKTGQTTAFLKDLFARRLQAVENYPVRSLAELLGNCPRNDNARARVARNEAPEDERDRYRYLYGEEVIGLMCSGDIHHMIRLVARMVDDFGGIERLEVGGSSAAIPPESQHQSIRNEAGAVMESIRTVPDVGPRLADIVTAFGKVAQSFLLHRRSKNVSASPPHQASKIEPYEALRLGEEAERMRDELLRYSVFIEDPKGKSRRGNVVPRLFLRRSLIPHFGLTFSQRDSVELENVDLELLLTKPELFERKFRVKRHKGKDVREHSGGSLFDAP